MLEIQKKYGLILKGANIILNDFTFERPFAAFGNNMFVKAVGGGTAMWAQIQFCEIPH